MRSNEPQPIEVGLQKGSADDVVRFFWGRVGVEMEVEVVVRVVVVVAAVLVVWFWCMLGICVCRR